jgi:hypothetical protein
MTRDTDADRTVREPSLLPGLPLLKDKRLKIVVKQRFRSA